MPASPLTILARSSLLSSFLLQSSMAIVYRDHDRIVKRGGALARQIAAEWPIRLKAAARSAAREIPRRAAVPPGRCRARCHGRDAILPECRVRPAPGRPGTAPAPE